MQAFTCYSWVLFAMYCCSPMSILDSALIGEIINFYGCHELTPLISFYTIEALIQSIR